MKRQATKWEKIVANHVLHNGLVSRIYKEHIIQKLKQITQVENGQRV